MKNISDSKACDIQSPDLWVYFESKFNSGLKKIHFFKRDFLYNAFAKIFFAFRFEISVKFRRVMYETVLFILDLPTLSREFVLAWICSKYRKYWQIQYEWFSLIHHSTRNFTLISKYSFEITYNDILGLEHVYAFKIRL